MWRAASSFSSSHERLAHGFVHRLEEGVRHRAADDQPIDPRDEIFDDFDLVGHLRPAQDRDERTLGVGERFAKIAQLLLHQQAGRRLWHQPRDGLDGGVRAMRGAERVVDIDIGERRQRSCKRGIVLFLFGVKAKILEQDEARGRRVLHRPLGVGPDAVPEKRYGRAEQFIKAGRHRT